ncbi:CaiB/BaiF CoA-transferase family protein [Desulfofundulus sp. TPOSR]|uniref:CaiB/BaiF CoA transferase family protein n=1 Tax=Desulfofundulus sp. TPOSR TaxID=2714340 RepID=UPI001A9AC1CE|nr:CaiB/BaiF CoA-transferase family protein [Desulfofundulus sp. TPOSR]
MYPLLEGMKVIDLTRLLPGGYATLLLADLGAEVVKVEDLGAGDYIRVMGPQVGKDSAWFHALNRNKKSVRLNLKDEQGKKIFCRMVEQFDVLIEGFRPGVMERLGLGYSVLAEVNPRLVYCSLSGYGQDGPYSQRPGHDINYISIAGALGLTGYRNGHPVPPAVQVADIGGGLMAVAGILAAYVQSLRTGRGAYVDVAMTDTVVSWLTLYITEYLATGCEPRRGLADLNGGQVCYGVYRTSDGYYISVGNLESKFWENFCTVAGRQDLMPLQHATNEEAFRVVEEFFQSKTRDEIMELFQEVDTCIEPVLDIKEVVAHPQIRFRNMIVETSDEDGRKVATVGNPLKFRGVVKNPDKRAPRLGEHTREILQRIGFNENEVKQLINKEIVG